MANECANAANSAFCVGDGQQYTAKSLSTNTALAARARLERKVNANNDNPDNPNADFEIVKVAPNVRKIKFTVDLPGLPNTRVYARGRQFDVSYKASNNPAFVPIRIAIGQEIQGNHENNATEGEATPVPGNAYAFNVKVDHGNGRVITYLIMVATDRNS